MGRMKDLFIELEREREDRSSYYPNTPSGHTCPNCNSLDVEPISVDYYDCMQCGYHLVLVENELRIN